MANVRCIQCGKERGGICGSVNTAAVCTCTDSHKRWINLPPAAALIQHVDDGLTPAQRECDHGCTFDEEQAKGLSAQSVRKLWPRFFGTCKRCGYSGIYYASYAHYIMGDW